VPIVSQKKDEIYKKIYFLVFNEVDLTKFARKRKNTDYPLLRSALPRYPVDHGKRGNRPPSARFSVKSESPCFCGVSGCAGACTTDDGENEDTDSDVNSAALFHPPQARSASSGYYSSDSHTAQPVDNQPQLDPLPEEEPLGETLGDILEAERGIPGAAERDAAEREAAERDAERDAARDAAFAVAMRDGAAEPAAPEISSPRRVALTRLTRNLRSTSNKGAGLTSIS
jgi:hypothetical protein